MLRKKEEGIYRNPLIFFAILETVIAMAEAKGEGFSDGTQNGKNEDAFWQQQFLNTDDGKEQQTGPFQSAE